MEADYYIYKGCFVMSHKDLLQAQKTNPDIEVVPVYRNAPERYFIKMCVNDGLPEISGKYIVITETSSKLKNINKFDARFDVEHKSWDVSNQVVKFWLKEIVRC